MSDKETKQDVQIEEVMNSNLFQHSWRLLVNGDVDGWHVHMEDLAQALDRRGVKEVEEQ
jgi:hypothetical protein